MIIQILLNIFSTYLYKIKKNPKTKDIIFIYQNLSLTLGIFYQLSTDFYTYFSK
jgi:hypothetical protein